eukprot:SAG31_NODE_166_length_21670_cov_22.507719_12_plen_78_part_00
MYIKYCINMIEIRLIAVMLQISIGYIYLEVQVLCMIDMGHFLKNIKRGSWPDKPVLLQVFHYLRLDLFRNFIDSASK